MKRIISGIMLTVLMLSVLALAFNIQHVKADGTTIAVVNPETGDNEFVFPPDTPVNTTFIANITVMNCLNLSVWQINMTWDPTLLNITKIDDLIIPSDNVFGIYTDVVSREIGNGTLFMAVGIAIDSSVNVTYGTLCQINLTIIRNDTGAPLSCNIHFVVQGEYPVYTKLVDFDAYEISYTPQDGTYIMLPSQDIGMVSVTTSKTVVGQGYNLNITAKILNYGAATATFDVAFYANTTKIGAMTVYDLALNHYANVTFTWNTSGFARAYVISANATILVGETNTTDNKLTDGTVKVSCRGDVNGDYRTDMLDYQRVKRALASTPSNPMWNSNADINDNLTVDNADFQIVKDNIPSHA